MVLLKTYLCFSLKIFQKNPASCVSLLAGVYSPESHKKSIPGESVFFAPWNPEVDILAHISFFGWDIEAAFHQKTHKKKSKQQKVWEIGQGRESDEKCSSKSPTLNQRQPGVTSISILEPLLDPRWCHWPGRWVWHHWWHLHKTLIGAPFEGVSNGSV